MGHADDHSHHRPVVGKLLQQHRYQVLLAISRLGRTNLPRQVIHVRHISHVTHVTNISHVRNFANSQRWQYRQYCQHCINRGYLADCEND